MTLPAGVMLPSALDRKQIFYTLKRWSSYTAWNRILRYYQAWADTIEKSFREASSKGWEDKTRLSESHYISILKGLAHCDDGVTRLRQGDKRVFRCDVNGDLAMASRGGYDHWWQAYIYIQTGDIAGGNAFTPYWDEFIAALVDLNDAWSECSPCIIEPNDSGETTHVAPLPYGDWLKANLLKMTFPEQLPEIAEPNETVLLRSGRVVPHSGIWEPVEVPRKKVFTLFKGPSPQGPFPVIAGMNYLHGGSSAPKATLETQTDNVDIDATWRLLWRDDRYIDGSVPEEEKFYVFLCPEATRAAGVTAPDSASIIILESGQRTPVAGRWVLQESLSVSITLSVNESLPLHQGRTARWIFADA